MVRASPEGISSRRLLRYERNTGSNAHGGTVKGMKHHYQIDRCSSLVEKLDRQQATLIELP